MSIEVRCGCGRSFEVQDSLAGGIANCPGCGRAADVPGLRDPIWKALLVGALIVWAGASALVTVAAGPAAGVIAAIALAILFWLISLGL